MFSSKYLNAKGKDLKRNTSLITLPTGYGKSYFANTEIIDYYEETTGEEINYALLLVPTLSIKEQVLKEYPNTKRFCSFQFLFEADTSKCVYVACFNQLVKWLRDGNIIRNPPKLTVIDEIHQVMEWNVYFDNLIAWEWLQSQRETMFLCGLTATPDYLINYVDEAFKELGLKPFDFKDITIPQPIKNTTNQIEIWQHTKLSTVLNTLEPTEQNKVFAFTENAKDCEELARHYNGGFLVSIYNDDLARNREQKLNELMESQEVKRKPFGVTTLRDYILENGEYPQEYNLVIANTAYNCGVNINDENLKTIVISSDDLSVIAQTIGRARHKTERIIICFTSYLSPTQENNEKRLNQCLMNIDNQDYLRGRYEEQQAKRLSEIKAEGKTTTDIVVCFYEGKYIINPFTLAAYNRKFEIFDNVLFDVEGYFSELEKFGAIPTFAEKIKASDIAEARNKRKIAKFDFEKWINRKLFKQDKEEIVNQLDLRNAQRRLLKWPSVQQNLIDNGYEVINRDSKAINPHSGKRERYLVIKKPNF